MRILFYPPFKPLDHPAPSGDQVIALGLVRYLESRGHEIRVPSRLRCRWIYLKPWLWPLIPLEIERAARLNRTFRPDVWLTYHTYYKAPDILGPTVCQRLDLPYVIFQAMYATKYRRRVKTRPGFHFNTKALLAARHVMTNRGLDYENLKRIVPTERLTYVAPGIYPEDFVFDPEARAELRALWEVGETPVVLSAAMFRPDVKTRGMICLFRALRLLVEQGLDFHVVVAGDGSEKDRLVREADECLPGRVRFAGKIPREMMYRFYSAGDLFAFPGFRESLGMVYLEAQACGLPVVAYDNGGIPEVVAANRSGLLIELGDMDGLAGAIGRLIREKSLRKEMGRIAGEYVRERHDLTGNYGLVESVLDMAIVSGKIEVG
jgi:glycosyltransferase involved in cell wall biosynthesis